MAFSLTKARAYKVQSQSPIDRYGLQAVELEVSRDAAGDITLDLSTNLTTFFTDIDASDYGERFKQFWGQVAGNVERLVSHEVLFPTLVPVRVASSPTNAQYALTNGGTYPEFKPSFTFANSSTPATLKIVLLLALKPGTYPLDFQ